MDSDVLQLATALVAIDSQNPGVGERDIAAFVEHEVARPAGFTVTSAELVPGRPNLAVSVDTGPGPHLALSGHLDTKPVGDGAAEWRTDPFQLSVVDGTAYGLGSSDMKGAVAAMLVALARHAQEGPPGRVSLVLTADEEQGSNAGAKALSEHGLDTLGLGDLDAMVLGEPCGVDDAWEMLALISRGICCFEVDVHTAQGHSGLSPRLGRNAVLVAADVLRALETFLPPVAEPGAVPASPTVNAGMSARGGVCFGTWPGQATVGAELRLVPGMDADQVRAAVWETVAQAVGDQGSFDIRYAEGGLGWMPAVELDPRSPVVAAAQTACSQVLGRQLPLAAYPGGTDATWFMEAGVPTIASLGPGWLSVAHGPNERVAVSDLYTAVDLYARLMAEFRPATD
jgi:acetylornithine deacetylase/succinyl-diaminopimelate desuccinylase-like protein